MPSTCTRRTNHLRCRPSRGRSLAPRPQSWPRGQGRRRSRLSLRSEHRRHGDRPTRMHDVWIVWVLGISARTAPRPPTGPAAPSTAARRSTGNGGGTPPRWTPGPRCRGYRGSNRSSAPARPSVESTHGQQFLVLRRAPRRVAGQERHRCRLFLPMGAHHGRSGKADRIPRPLCRAWPLPRRHQDHAAAHHRDRDCRSTTSHGTGWDRPPLRTMY